MKFRKLTREERIKKKEARMDPYDVLERRLQRKLMDMQAGTKEFDDVRDELRSVNQMRTESRESKRRISKSDKGGLLIKIVSGLFGAAGLGAVDAGALEYLRQNAVYYLAAVVCSTPLIAEADRRFRACKLWNIGYALALGAILVISVVFIFSQIYNPFIYFNF